MYWYSTTVKGADTGWASGPKNCDKGWSKSAYRIAFSPYLSYKTKTICTFQTICMLTQADLRLHQMARLWDGAHLAKFIYVVEAYVFKL